MTEKQKKEFLLEILSEAGLPWEMEKQLILYIEKKCKEDSFAKNFIAGAEFMRSLASRTIQMQEESCNGSQRAALTDARHAVERLEILGIG